jgi:hypothetical protein
MAYLRLSIFDLASTTLANEPEPMFREHSFSKTKSAKEVNLGAGIRFSVFMFIGFKSKREDSKQRAVKRVGL